MWKIFIAERVCWVNVFLYLARRKRKSSAPTRLACAFDYKWNWKYSCFSFQSHFIAKAAARRWARSSDWEVLSQSVSTRVSPCGTLAWLWRGVNGKRFPYRLQELPREVLRHASALRRHPPKYQPNASAERQRCQCASEIARSWRKDCGRHGEPAHRYAKHQVSARTSPDELLCFMQGT